MTKQQQKAKNNTYLLAHSYRVLKSGHRETGIRISLGFYQGVSGATFLSVDSGEKFALKCLWPIQLLLVVELRINSSGYKTEVPISFLAVVLGLP